ncbi:RiPP maturation radical SAM C-methyltransferase [Natronosporangium hydrolyticum]|uniref:RiPP maturation radical SAM C-methyltransferase n=1 Tax=Natronosporangium hydrolyticum TaxID=2811111 RepID=A0A895Y8D1_9ACTN|nr:RiPP maturation radical SAM C-methyltransferase [Natronosporangium hydrolyticum]QSB12555.1 RiPP maturation radical SAM C-methyltransferase [Natronosporangium hydrolyticum]
MVEAETYQAALAGIDGLCWRATDGEPVTNPQQAPAVPVAAIPPADLTHFFEQFARATSVSDIDPKIQLEGARGCWWGEKHHCTFCGLNGSLMGFRAKSADRLLAEITDAVRRHRTLDVVFADNIMDMGYIRDLVPKLSELDWDLRLFFEAKSNLSFAQLRALADGKVTQLQPGVESLSSNVLRLMRKGVAAWQNVRMLRDCRTLAIYPGWNILYGFPGETADDYAEVVRQMSFLRHLTPPEGCYRVVLTRFSPYFQDPSLGLINRGPSALLSKVYRLPKQELAQLGYLFESEKAGIRGEDVQALEAATRDWHTNHAGRRLVAIPDGSALRIVDERSPSPSEHVLKDPVETTAFHATLRGRSAAAVHRQLEAAGLSVSGEQVADLIHSWHEQGWMFRDGDYFVALPTGLSYD